MSQGRDKKDPEKEVATMTLVKDRPNVRALFQGLTPKGRLFCLEYVKTSNATEAAARVYDVKDRVNAAQIGTENLGRPLIKKAISELLGTMYTESHVYSRIGTLSLDAKSQDTQLKASVELGKLLGMYDKHQNQGSGATININIDMPKRAQSEIIDADYRENVQE